MVKERNVFSNLLEYLHYGLLSIEILLMAVILIGCKDGLTNFFAALDPDPKPTSIEGSLSYDAIITSFGEGAIRSATSKPTGTVTYSIAPESGGTMPTGITIEETTGVITVSLGAAVQAITWYTVTATGTGNYGSTVTATVGITIAQAELGTLSYNAIISTYGEISTSTPASNLAEEVTYSIAPESGGTMPTGITIEETTGVITVANTATLQAATEYIVTATVTATGTGTGNYKDSIDTGINISIVPIQITGILKYTTITINMGSTDSSLAKWTGGDLNRTVTYSVGVTLPTGIELNSNTGEITVGANTAAQDTSYTVTATANNNYTGQITATIRIFVIDPDSYKYTPTTKAELITAIDTEIGIQGDTANLNMINTQYITDMSVIFRFKAGFNGDISEWNVSNVTNMGGMFYEANAFNGDISDWNVSNVTNMILMFWGSTAFNSDINSWDVSNVTDMDSMFYGATTFNSDISDWNVSSVTNMGGMFYEATAFNGDISGWNVSNVTNMNSMFFRATTFNNDISGWDVSSVADMGSMFFIASAFNQNLETWNVAGSVNKSFMFTDSGMGTTDIPSWYW